MIDLNQLEFWKRKPGNSLLGLSFDGSRLEGVLVRRTNGSVEVRKTFSVSLSLDPLTAEVELAGREIRKQLDTEQIKERWCVVCLPLSWALTLTVKLPEIAEEDVADFLQLEAERGFPYGPEEMMLAHSQFKAGDEKFATLVGVPREHVTRLDAVLHAAQLRPVTFSLALTALMPEAAEGTLALLPGESSVAMQISSGGGVVSLRTLDGAYEQVGAERELQTEHIVRELRITLGHLPHAVRDALKTVRVFGRSEAAIELAEELQASAQDWGVKVESVREHPTKEFGLKLPPGAPISGALSLAVRQLAGVGGMEFLPPKISAWQQFSQRYSSGKVAYAGMAAGAVAVVVLLAFLVQQIILWHWEKKWSAIEQPVIELKQVSGNISRYRPWYDDSVRSLAILKRITEAFPENGAVSAKTVELRDSSRVTCSGTALNREAFIKMLDQLRTNGVSDVHIEMTRGNKPLEFTFNFQWGAK